VQLHHNYERDSYASEPEGFWAGQQAGLLICGLAAAAAFLMAKLIA
jgi:hypothetical protein